jgi:hypothetical protein
VSSFLPHRAFILSLSFAVLIQAQNDFSTVLKQRHQPKSRPFAFAAIGDQQYGETGLRKWPALQESINQASELKFVVHAGDIKSGAAPCDDAMFASRRKDFNRFRAPLILTPGDNEWTDCHRSDAGAYDTLDRLALLRKTFYPDAYALGQRKMRLSRQSEDPRWAKFVENAMWSEGPVLFASVHIVGSNNNFGRNAGNDAEWKERTEANRVWLDTIFRLAKENRFRGLVLLTHANPGFRINRSKPSQLQPGARENYSQIAQLIADWGQPVLLIHGDSHQFRIDKPLRDEETGKLLDRLTRLEVPGSADVHWVRVIVNPALPQLFSFEHRDVVANWEHAH